MYVRFRPMTEGSGWLLLVHQLPARPLYLRAQVRRRLAQVGALPLKNSVVRVAGAAGVSRGPSVDRAGSHGRRGQASVCRAEFMDAGTAGELRARFVEAANERFAPIRAALLGRRLSDLRRRSASGADAHLVRVQRLVDEAARVDFFESEKVWRCTRSWQPSKLLRPLSKARPGKSTRKKSSRTDVTGQVWVTRRDPHIDRLATAWLVRRFVDPKARFLFVDPAAATAKPGERSFDFLGAEFTHEGDRCSFETLCGGRPERRRPPATRGNRSRSRPERRQIRARGCRRHPANGRRIVGLAPDSAARVEAALPVFDTLHASFGGRPRA